LSPAVFPKRSVPIPAPVSVSVLAFAVRRYVSRVTPEEVRKPIKPSAVFDAKNAPYESLISTAATASIPQSPLPCVRQMQPEPPRSPRSGTLKKSSVRPSSAATSSNWAGEIFSSRWATSKPIGVLPGLVAVYWKGPPATLQTHRVRINLRPGSLPRLLVCHSRRAGFSDLWPTIGF